MSASEVVPWEEWVAVPTVDESGRERPVAEIVAQASALPPRRPFRLTGRPLAAESAAELFRRLGAAPRRFFAALTLDAIERKSVLEDAARSGCVAIEVHREGALVEALASGIDAGRAPFSRTVTALRRARGLGIATVARLDLGRPGDDEGVFERTLRFCRRALIAVPIVEASGASAPADAAPAFGPATAPVGAMDHATLENGVRWILARLNSHAAIWRRALWPAGARGVALQVGYGLRRISGRRTAGRYTATMHLLRRLNRTHRTHRRAQLLPTLAAPESLGDRPRVLRLRATANEQTALLFIAVDGALDLRGARALLERVRQALQAGFQRITIDFAGLEWVASDVVTRFVGENRARLGELARWIQLENLQGVALALRQQLGDVEAIRLIESAADA
jgi:hypothetical protein